MPVNDILKEQDDLVSHAHRFFLWPRAWLGFANNIPLAWQLNRLATVEAPNVPASPGVYSLLVRPEIADHPACSYLMYVGKTRSLRRRFREYLLREKQETGRPKIFRLLMKYPDHVWFCFANTPLDAIDELEDALIRAYMPPMNDQFPVEVRRVIGAF